MVWIQHPLLTLTRLILPKIRSLLLVLGPEPPKKLVWVKQAKSS
jgi:hypothetical protein